jgi:uncharacterized damage-inducible protein DinB
MMSAESGWLERAGGPPRGPRLRAGDFPTFLSITEKWKHIEGQMREFLAAIREEDLDRVVEFAMGDGPKQTISVAQMMHHAAVHGVHHRGQIALLLRLLGYAPGDVDLLFYYTRAGSQRVD